MASRPVPMAPKLGRSPKHGSRALVRLIKAGALDRRTKPAKRIEELVGLIAEDFGGRDRLPNISQLRARTVAGLLVALEPWLQRLARDGVSAGGEDHTLTALLNSAMRGLDALADQARTVAATMPAGLDLGEYLRAHAETAPETAKEPVCATQHDHATIDAEGIAPAPTDCATPAGARDGAPLHQATGDDQAGEDDA